jgi:protoheme IX farnesyltransferase
MLNETTPNINEGENNDNKGVHKRSLFQEIVALSKPRVIELLITTALPAMFFAEKGIPNGFKVIGVLIGGYLSAGSSNAINSIIEAKTDQKMVRTRNRPMAQARLTKKTAWTAAIVAQISSFVIMVLLCNVLSAFLTLFASFFYVVIYTIWLKPRTEQNIVIGGAAGALPVLIGYSAVTSNISLDSIIMFTIVFLWTPPHFWALATYHEDDYRNAGFPMLPVNHSRKSTTFQMLVYTILTVLCSLLLIFSSVLNLIYIIFSAILGVWFIFYAIRLYRLNEKAPRKDFMKFFHLTNGYLALLFIVIAIDSVVS